MSGRIRKDRSESVDPCAVGERAIKTTGSAPDADRTPAAAGQDDLDLHALAEIVPRLLWAAGPGGEFTHINSEWMRFTGNAKERNLGTGWMDRIHPKDSPEFQRVYSEALEQRKPFNTIIRLERHDGRHRWFVLQGVPRFHEGGSFAGFAGCGLDITEQKELTEIPFELSGRLIQAQEAERSRIARELHDDISQRVALLTNGIQELEQPRSHMTAAQQRHQLHALRRQAMEIAADVQFLSHQLHPSKLQYLGLTAAIRSLCLEMSARHKLDVACMVRDIPEKLSEGVSLSLFRIAQESLQNVVKHSHARHATVELVGQSDAIRLRVSDDGIGFDTTVGDISHGLGLVSMRERLNSVGGSLSISSRPKSGTQIEGTVPIRPKPPDKSTGRPHL